MFLVQKTGFNACRHGTEGPHETVIHLDESEALSKSKPHVRFRVHQTCGQWATAEHHCDLNNSIPRSQVPRWTRPELTAEEVTGVEALCSHSEQ